MVSATSARPRGARPAVPAKMTSSIFPPRRLLAPCSPMTHASASTTLDFPEPLGPTTQVMPGSRRIVVAEAKDLKPFRVSVLRYMRRVSALVGAAVGPGRPGRGRLYRRGRGAPGRRRRAVVPVTPEATGVVEVPARGDLNDLLRSRYASAPSAGRWIA